MEEERIRQMLECLLRMKEIEEERSNPISLMQNQKEQQLNLKGSEFLTFKNIKDPQQVPTLDKLVVDSWNTCHEHFPETNHC